MSNDRKTNKNKSNDTGLNSTPMRNKSKTEFIDFDTCMTRLRAISGHTRDSKVLQYFDIPQSTYSNWLRRGRLNTGTLVGVLLAQGTSLDKFFAPDQILSYPAGVAEAQALGIHEPELVASSVSLTLRALTRIEPLLQELNIELSEAQKELLVDTYFGQRNETVSLSFALQQVAKALVFKDELNRTTKRVAGRF